MLEQNAFALTAFADDGGDITFKDLQVDSVQDRPPTESLGNIFKFYDGRIRHGTPYTTDPAGLNDHTSGRDVAS